MVNPENIVSQEPIGPIYWTKAGDKFIQAMSYLEIRQRTNQELIDSDGNEKPLSVAVRKTLYE